MGLAQTTPFQCSASDRKASESISKDILLSFVVDFSIVCIACPLHELKRHFLSTNLSVSCNLISSISPYDDR